MKNIFYSIIIPVYNSENTILKCIESCLMQTYENFEIIIVDDCSADNTVALIQEYIQTHGINNIFVNQLKYNQGPSVARNKGIELAQGDFIALLDSDDYFEANKLETVSQALAVNTSIDLLGHNYKIFVETEPTKSYTVDVILSKLIKISCIKLLLKNFAVTPSIVFKKSMNIKFDEAMRYTEDHDFFLRACMKNYKIFYLDLPLVSLSRTVLSKGGQSSNRIKMRLGEFKMYMKLYKNNILFFLLIPFLVIFSLTKHFIQFIKRFKRNNDASN